MAKRSTAVEPTFDALMDEFRALIGSIEDVYAAVADSSDEKITEMKGQAEANLMKAKATLGNIKRHAAGKAREISADSDDYVHESPWTAVGFAAAIGVLLGVLIARR